MRPPHGLAAAVAFAALLLPRSAEAGTYKVQMCRLADGSPAPVNGWSGLTHDTCPTGGSFGLTWPNGAGVGASATATLTVPANVAIVRADLWRSFAAPVSWQTAQPRVQSTWETRGWQGGGYLGDADDLPYNPARPTDRLEAHAPSGLSLGLQCLWSGDATPNACTGLVAYRAYKLDLHMADGVAPQVTRAPSGPLLHDGWLTDATAAMTIGASDVGAGAYRAFVRIGSTTRYARLGAGAACLDADPDAGTAYDFDRMVPCATADATYTPTFDLAGIGDGTHTGVTIGIEDAAGNERVALTGRTLRINAPGGALPDPGTPCPGGVHDEAGACHVTAPAEGGSDEDDGGSDAGSGGGAGAGGGVAPVSLPAPIASEPDAPRPPAAAPDPARPADGERRGANGVNATTAAVLELRARGAGRRRIAVRYGRRVTVEGRLLTPGGRPIAGATIDVLATPRSAPSRATREPSLTSDGDGRFRLVLAAGPSRVVRFAYRAFADDPDYAEVAEVDLRVRSAPTLRGRPRSLRNGSAVRFRGRVAGAPAGSRKVVELQVRQRGRWRTFATTRLRRGRFEHRYRFTRTVRRTTYAFRAVVRTEAGWPYETGGSNVAKVVVRP